MKTILIIAEAGNFLMTSISEKLKEQEYAIHSFAADVNEVGQYKEAADGILIFADETLADRQELLVYLKDRSLEENTPLFLIGDEDSLKEIRRTLTDSNIKLEFKRPIDVSDVVKRLDKYLQEHDRNVKKKVLVIDDSGAMLRNIKGWLEDKYQVILANSGTMGIKYMSQSLPDLVLLDYEMPVIDGRQVLEMIRSESDFSAVPVIFLTSKNDKESIMKVLGLKPEGYLLKTMKPAEIVKAVDDFFEKRKYDVS